MASPQKEHGYTPVANEIIEQLIKLPLNGTQWRIVAVVWRYTYGFSRKEHEISETFILKALDFTRTQLRQVKRELKSLIEAKIITVIREASFNRTRVIAFNKNYEQWCLKSTQGTNKTLGGNLDTQPGDGIDTKSGDNLDTQENNNKTNTKTIAYESFFESIWQLYPNKKGKAGVSKSQKLKLSKIGYEEMTRAIERYKQDINGMDMQYIKHGSTFFNSGYIDYLDKNYVEPVQPKTRGW